VFDGVVSIIRWDIYLFIYCLVSNRVGESSI
jgi:hypothetical protein